MSRPGAITALDLIPKDVAEQERPGYKPRRSRPSLDIVLACCPSLGPNLGVNSTAFWHGS
jgi:hypothetical protein